MDLGVRYGSDAMKALMYDDWDHGGMDFVAGDGGSENRHTNAGTPDGLPSLPETPHTPLAPPRPPPSPSPSWSTLPEPCYSGLQEHYKPLEPRNGTPSSTIRGSTSSHSLFVSSSIPSRISLPQRPSVYPQQPVVRVDPGVVRQETDETWTAVAMHSPWSSGVFPPSLASTSPPPYEYRSGDVDLGMPELESTSTSRGGQDLQEYARTFSELQRDDW